MAQVNKLTGKVKAQSAPPAPPVAPKPKPAVSPPPTPRPPRPTPKGKPVDEVSETTALVPATPQQIKALQKSTAGIAVPAFLQKTSLPDVIQSEVGGYVGFADPQSKKWPQMQNAGCEQGDPFVYTDQQYYRCVPLEYVLLMGDSFRVTMQGQEGKFTFATRDTETPLRDLAEAIENQQRRAACLKAEPHYCCLVLARIGDSLVPVKADFRGTKSGAASGAIIAVKSAEDAEWLRLSEAHKVTAAFPHPWGRVWHTVTTHYKVGKTSGNGFYVAKCSSKPATIDQMQMLVDAFNDDEFNAKLEEAEKSYQMRLAFFDKIALGEEEKEPGDNASAF